MTRDPNSLKLDDYYTAFEDDEMREIARATLETNLESARGMVLVMASLIDIRLETLLRSILDDCQATKKLFDEANAPLSSFNSKINLTRSLRLIREDEFRNLNIVRKIRNDFAHKVNCSFEDRAVRDRAFAIDYGLANLDRDKCDARAWFQMGCSALILNLYHRTKDTRKDN